MDATKAWEHLLDVEPGSPGTSGPLQLHADGSWSASDDLDDDAVSLLDIFAPLRVQPRFVVGQLGQSVDGRIATVEGHSHYINGPEDIHRLHRLRAMAQAVVVGAGTVASDDPRLTVRHVAGPNPVRVVLDPSGRLDPHRSVFHDGMAPTLWVRAAASPEATMAGGDDETVGHPGAGYEGADHPEADHLEIVELPAPDGRFEPYTVVEHLARRGLQRVLVEGGGITVSSFLAAGALDRLHLSVAPLLLGSGRPSITLPTISTLDQAMRPTVRHFRLGDDLLFDLDLQSTEA